MGDDVGGKISYGLTRRPIPFIVFLFINLPGAEIKFEILEVWERVLFKDFGRSYLRNKIVFFTHFFTNIYKISFCFWQVVPCAKLQTAESRIKFLITLKTLQLKLQFVWDGKIVHNLLEKGLIQNYPTNSEAKNLTLLL